MPLNSHDSASQTEGAQVEYYTTRNPFDRPVCVTRPKSVAALPVALSGRELLLHLCQMPAGVVAPLLTSDMADLTDDLLVELCEMASPAHQSLIAARARIGKPVVKALIRRGTPEALEALMANASVALDDEDREALIQLGGKDERLHQALLSRADTRPELIRRRRQQADDGHSANTSNLRFLKAIRCDAYARALELAAPRVGIGTQALRRGLGRASALPGVLLFRALELDKAIYTHCLPKWLVMTGADIPLEDAKHPVVMALFDLTPQSAAARLRALCR